MKVSVVIPCYNGEAFIADAIHSVLKQSLADLECLVVDDASADASRDIIRALAGQDARVKPLLLEKNAGPAAARNRGFDAAGGDWIALLDADDYYRPDRLERLLGVAAECQADIVIDNISQILPDGSVRPSAFEFLAGEKPLVISAAEFCRLNIATGRGMPIGFSKPMFRRDFLDRHQLRLDPRYRVGEDYLLLAECVLGGAKLAATSYCGYVYRVLESSLTRSARLADLKGLSDIHDRLLSCPAARDPLTARYLQAQKRTVHRYIHLREVREFLGGRRYGSALMALAAHPDIALVALSAARQRLQRFLPMASHV